MTKLKNLIGRTVSIRHRNRHIGFGELNIDSSGLYSVWGLRFAPTDVIAIDPITKPKRDGEMDEWSVGAASVIRLIDPLPNDIAMATAERNVHNITLPGAGFSPDTLLCILIGSWVENGGCWADVIEIDALKEWARARQLPEVVYRQMGLKRIFLAYLDFFGIGRPSALLLYWQWLSDAPIAQIRAWAERIHQMHGLPSLNRPNNFERFLNYSEFPSSSIVTGGAHPPKEGKMTESKKLYALIEDHSISDYPTVIHKAFWLAQPTSEQIWAILSNVHDSIWYTREIAEGIAAGEALNYHGEESQFTAYIGSYTISE